MISQRCGAIGPMTGVLCWRYMGSLGRTAWEDEEREWSLCMRAAGVHGVLPEDGGGANREFMGQD